MPKQLLDECDAILAADKNTFKSANHNALLKLSAAVRKLAGEEKPAKAPKKK